MLKTEYIDINKLKLLENNPRQINVEKFSNLCASIKKNKDYFEARPILANKEMVVFAGNMRWRAAKEIGMEKVPTIIMDVTKEKQNEYMLRDNISNGEWDWDLLPSYDRELLEEVGFSDELASIFGDKPEEDESYTNKIVPPVYKPSEETPDLKDVYDETRAGELRKLVDQANIVDSKLKEFLLSACNRFTVFNYAKVADLYSNSEDKITKDLMEKLALVIIDYDKAIENGFVKVSEQLFDNMEKE